MRSNILLNKDIHTCICKKQNEHKLKYINNFRNFLTNFLIILITSEMNSRLLITYYLLLLSLQVL